MSYLNDGLVQDLKIALELVVFLIAMRILCLAFDWKGFEIPVLDHAIWAMYQLLLEGASTVDTILKR